jgi:hypothetical protein
MIFNSILGDEMKKAIIASVLLICSLAITTVVFAQQLKVEPVREDKCIFGLGEGCIIPKPIPPTPRPPYDVQMAYGVAVDKYYLTTKPVLFFVFRNNYWDTKMYLILDGGFYRMEQTESRYDWNTNTRIFKYRDDYGSEMVLTAQEFSDGISVSAVYKNYIITFEPIRYGTINPEPLIEKTRIMPLMPAFQQVTQSIGTKAGMTTENMISQAKPIAEWTQKGK